MAPVDSTPLVTPSHDNNEDQDALPSSSSSSIATPASSRPAKLTLLFTLAIVTACLLLYVAPAKKASSKFLVYGLAGFEILSGIMFVVDPSKLHNGWVPEPGMATYVTESKCIEYPFWGILLILKINDPTVLWLNAAYCAVWVLYLGAIWLGLPWRSRVQLEDGSWAVVPVVVKTICGVASCIAAQESL